MSKKIKVAKTSELKPGEAITITIEDNIIALFQLENGNYTAIDNTCTHVGGPLAEGRVEGDIVSCPWHHAQFNVKTGECLTAPAQADVSCYKVTVDGEDIFIEL